MRLPRGAVQQSVLLAVARQAAAIGDLARKLELARPSVSRAVTSLVEGGHVVRQDRLIEATETGRALAATIASQLPDEAITAHRRIQNMADQHERLQRAMQPVLGNTATRPVTTSYDRFFSSVATTARLYKQFQGILPSLQVDLVSAQTTYQKSLDAWTGAAPLFERAATTIAPSAALADFIPDVTRLYRMQLGLLESPNLSPLMGSATLVRDILRANLAWTAAMSADLALIRSTVRSSAIPVGSDVLVTSMSDVVRAHEKHVDAVLGSIGKAASAAGFAPFSVAVPTFSTARLVSTTRQYVDVEAGSANLTPPALGNEVPERLQRIHPELVVMWSGAWAAVRDGRPDGHRQGAHSMREILIQLLERLAPDDRFTAEDIATRGSNGRVTRAMRASHVVEPLTGTGAEWAVAIERSVDATYELLSAEAHTRSGSRFSRDAMLGLMETAAGLITFLLGCQEDRPRS